MISEATYEKRGIERRVNIKLDDKLNGLKHLGLFSERHLLGGLDGGEIKHQKFIKVVFVEPPKRANAHFTYTENGEY